MTPIPANSKERRVGITQERYLALFLEANDFSSPMRRSQDTRLNGPDPVNIWFAKYQGILAGFTVWTSSQNAVISRLVDARTVFPTQWQASAFHAEAMLYNSERMPPVTGAPSVAEECSVFGGKGPELFGPGTGLTIFFYLFRVHRVVVKLFAAQGVESPGALTAEPVAEVARRIVSRIETLDVS